MLFLQHIWSNNLILYENYTVQNTFNKINSLLTHFLVNRIWYAFCWTNQQEIHFHFSITKLFSTLYPFYRLVESSFNFISCKNKRQTMIFECIIDVLFHVTHFTNDPLGLSDYSKYLPHKMSAACCVYT